VERAEVEAHLVDCSACRDELARFAGLPGLLSRVTVEDVIDPFPSPPPGMVERLIARQRAARRAWRQRLAVAASAVAIAAVGAVVVVVAVQDTGGPGSTAQVASVSATNHRTGVGAKMELRPSVWGTAVRVRLRGVPAGTRCRLIVRSRAGRREVAGTWRADYSGAADVQTATAIPRSEVKSLAIVTTAGRPLVRASVD
jgi:hypothetical protein